MSFNKRMIKVDNAIIMAAGMSTRFVPLSIDKPKALIKVKNEVLIERMIKQLREKNIQEIIIVTGYKSETLEYLKEKFNVILIHNPEYNTRNNHASLYYAQDYLKNSYICSADNYYPHNVFNYEETASYYLILRFLLNLQTQKYQLIQQTLSHQKSQ